ncbi:MAG TPA: signal peptide peptidase SppA [Steroidobacteraceae bacterium]|nr:signal peptide peptidase SppA [Steroidobacteraceae bacterium]
MSTIRGILHGIWLGLEGLRKVLHLLLLLVIFGFLIGLIRSAAPRVPQKAALVLSPEGELVEQLSGDAVARAVAEARGQNRAETLVWDLIDSVKSAQKDQRIKALVLDLDQLEGSSGLPTLEELAHAIRDFRTSGKKVIAYGTTFQRDQYYLAAQADEVYLDPLGYVLIEGYGRYRWYYKEALDKLNVDINVFRVGQYKSAVEEYTRTDMSPQDREESLGYLNALWTRYQKGITTARKLQPDALDRYVGSLSAASAAAKGAAGSIALQAGLVTALKSKIDVEKRLIGLVGEDPTNGTYHGISSQDYVKIVHAQNTLSRGDKARVGVIVAAGEIQDGTQPPGTVGGETLTRLIRQARLDDKIHAVVLRVDSPGGSVNASEQIYREIQALKAAGKPVVVSMSSLAASGGYYISAPADEIWASPATITGSIGIFAIIPTIQKPMNKYLGISVDGIGTAPLSGQLRLDRPMSEDAKTLIQSIVEHGYDEFLARVSAGRHKTREQVDEIGQGRVWAGTDGARLGLVDHLGSFEDAVKAAAKRAKLGDDYKVQFIEPELSWAQQLALSINGRVMSWVAASDPGVRALSDIAQHLDPLTREIERLNRFSSTPNRAVAYCFCAPE